MPAPRFELEFDETFEGDALDEGRWLAHYLPHWSTWEASSARYELTGGQLHLLIEEGQAPWCPEIDGELRVSSLQTGLVAGPAGSHSGQHPFDPPATVRNGPHDIRLYTPHFGRIEIRCDASADPRLMVAFWMIGLGDAPERTAEICVCEIFGRDVKDGVAGVGVGVHPHQDPAVLDDFERVPIPLRPGELHDYAAEWTPDRIEFFIDGRSVKVVEQAIGYPMQLMLGIYEFPAEPGRPPVVESYPKRFVVEYVRDYRYLR